MESGGRPERRGLAWPRHRLVEQRRATLQDATEKRCRTEKAYAHSVPAFWLRMMLDLLSAFSKAAPLRRPRQPRRLRQQPCTGCSQLPRLQFPSNLTSSLHWMSTWSEPVNCLPRLSPVLLKQWSAESGSLMLCSSAWWSWFDRMAGTSGRASPWVAALEAGCFLSMYTALSSRRRV